MHSQLVLKHFYRNCAIAIAATAIAATLAGCEKREAMLHGGLAVQEADDGRIATAKSGDLLIVGGGTVTSDTGGKLDFKATETAEIFKIATKSFVKTGSMTTGRGVIQAVAFPGGALKHQVLVPAGVSGDGSFGPLGVFVLNDIPQKSSELFKGSSFTDGGTMNGERSFYTATLLKNGKVLIAGGFKGTTPLKTAELYDPATKTYAPLSMKAARAAHSATLLPNGQVLLAGGVTDTHGTTSSTAEVFNPKTNKFSLLTSTFFLGLAGHTATLISGCACSLDGKVVFVGGFRGTGNSASPATEFSVNDVIVYDPAAKTFSTGSSMKEARSFHTATLIGGKLHIIGGSNGAVQFGNGWLLEFAGSQILKTAEVFTASAGTWTCVGGVSGSNCKDVMAVRRGGHTATYFSSGAMAGKVLVIGGNGDRTTEIYNPTTGKFTVSALLRISRAFHAAVLVP